MTHGEAFRVLGLRPGASLAEIRQAHDELLAQWHPDRHGQDPQAAALAETRRTEIGTALAVIAPAPPPEPADPAPPLAAQEPALAGQSAPALQAPWQAEVVPLAPSYPSFGLRPPSRRSAGVRNMIVGVGLALLGVAVTFLTHEAAAASDGGTYLIMYGPMVGGGLLFFQGLAQTLSSGR